MPVDYSKYPDNWKTEIVPAVKERAGHKCEWCGAPNYAVGYRDSYGEFHANFWPENYGEALGIRARQNEFESMLPAGERTKWIIIVLTVAHIHDHNPMNCDPDNLAALCQKCHLTHDAPMHAKNAAETRQRKRDKRAGQIDLFEEVA